MNDVTCKAYMHLIREKYMRKFCERRHLNFGMESMNGS